MPLRHISEQAPEREPSWVPWHTRSLAFHGTPAQAQVLPQCCNGFLAQARKPALEHSVVWQLDVLIQQELSDIASRCVPDTGVGVGHAEVGGQDVVLRYRPQLRGQLHALSDLGGEGQHYWDVAERLLEQVEQARLTLLLGVERALGH